MEEGPISKSKLPAALDNEDEYVSDEEAEVDEDADDDVEKVEVATSGPNSARRQRKGAQVTDRDSKASSDTTKGGDESLNGRYRDKRNNNRRVSAIRASRVLLRFN